jgi:Ca-activated chloride channel family protein
MFNLADVQFGQPQLLWYLAAPGVLLLLWVRQLLLRRRDARRLADSRQVPLRERFPIVTPALFSFFVILAAALLIVALARPRVETSFVRTGSVDTIVLLDGSASMHVNDVNGTRWQRSIRFLRTFGDSLSWERDRIALTLFAHIAAPQVRLTNDPNTLFFFLDHLVDRSPFRLEDDTTWDTNIALGISWGLRVLEKDEEIRGETPAAKVFILITDGQAWSGTVEESIAAVRARGIPIHVVGVGTVGGGIIPDPTRLETGAPEVRSSLDRESLRRIAVSGGGQYLELERTSDADVANRIIDAGRRRAQNSAAEVQLQEVYWPFLLAAAICLALALLFLRERTELLIQLAGSAAALWVLTVLLS